MQSLADSELGQKYYVIYMKEETGLKGSVFTKQHTQAEWKALFDHNGEKFAAEYGKKYPALKAFLKSGDFQEVRIDIRDFCIEYAKDTMGMAAGC
jgi:hypothetical protein